MAETENLDSGQAGTTTQTTNSGGSTGNGDQQSSLEAAKLQSTLEALAKKLDEVDARSKALQGDKDRDVKQTRKDVEELKRKIAEVDKLKEKGLGLDDALEEISFRDDVRGLREQLSKLNPVSTQTAGNGANGADESARLVAEMKVNANDPKVIQILGEGDLVTKAAKLAEYKASLASNQPDTSAAPAMKGGTASAPDEDAMVSEMAKLQEDPIGNKLKIQELKKKLGW